MILKSMTMLKAGSNFLNMLGLDFSILVAGMLVRLHWELADRRADRQ